MRNMMVVTLLLAVVLAGAASTHAQGKASFYVAVDGDDRWSGTLPAPNRFRTDGPFKTLFRARDALRERKDRPGFRRGDLTVMVRGGTYFMPETLVLTPKDSGTKEHPVRYLAYPGEKPVLSGGRPITGWKPAGNGLYTTTLPSVKTGQWYFRQLRVGDRWQQQARHPNYDEKDPIHGGWLLADDPQGAEAGLFGSWVINIGSPGEWLEWGVDIPAAGDYRLFLYAAVSLKEWGNGMAGRTAFRVDDGQDIVLQGLPDTGDWNSFVWSECATLSLQAGHHVLRWTDLQGGGLNFDAFCLTDDPAYTPQGTDLALPADGKYRIVVQAETYEQANAPQLAIKKFSSPKYFTYPKGSVQAWSGSLDKEVHLFPAWGWVSSINSVDRIDDNTRTIFLDPPCPDDIDIRVGNQGIARE